MDQPPADLANTNDAKPPSHPQTPKPEHQEQPPAAENGAQAQQQTSPEQNHQPSEIKPEADEHTQEEPQPSEPPLESP